MVDALAPFAGEDPTVHAALEVSGTSWVLAVGDPADASKTGVHRLAPHDVGGLLAKLGQAPSRALARGLAAGPAQKWEKEFPNRGRLLPG